MKIFVKAALLKLLSSSIVRKLQKTVSSCFFVSMSGSAKLMGAIMNCDECGWGQEAKMKIESQVEIKGLTAGRGSRRPGCSN